MNMMKWLFSVVLSFGLLVGCSQNESKSEQKAISKTEQKEKLKQEEKKEESKPEEQQESVEKKQQEELQKDNQEQKSQEQPEIKNEEKKEQEPVAQQKQQGQTKAQQEQPEPAKAPEAKEEAVVKQPKETPKQEQQKDPEPKVVPKPEPQPEPKPEPKPEEKKVTISVHGDQGYLLGAKKVDMQEGTTVFDVLKNTGLEIDSTGSGNSKYIKGINDLYEFDKGPKSGWKYRVNGTFPNRSAGAYKVKPGDKIEWVYVLN